MDPNIQEKEQIPDHRNENFRNKLEKEKTKRDRIRNYTIREQLEVAPLIKKIEKGQLRWLGHIERMNDERIAKRRWNLRPDRRKSVGRPRKRWLDEVEEIL